MAHVWNCDAICFAPYGTILHFLPLDNSSLWVSSSKSMNAGLFRKVGGQEGAVTNVTEHCRLFNRLTTRLNKLD